MQRVQQRAARAMTSIDTPVTCRSACRLHAVAAAQMPSNERDFTRARRRPDAVSRDHIAVHMPQPRRSGAGPDAVACRGRRSDAVRHALPGAVAAGQMPYPIAGPMP